MRSPLTISTRTSFTTDLFDTNDRLVKACSALGTANLPRDQGQILIANNTVSDSLQFGILRVDAGQRDAGGSLQRPGGVRELPTLNNERLVTGVKVENNVISNFGTGGILFSGDPNTGTLPLASVPFGRIMNNTIYGSATSTGVGIQVTENASPTILNNIVANTVDGLTIDGTSLTSVVGANLFSGNTNNGVVGQNAILLQPTDPLFVDPANGNFYLAGGTLAVDSSLNSLADRINFVAVNSPLGIPPSPIIAPNATDSSSCVSMILPRIRLQALVPISSRIVEPSSELTSCVRSCSWSIPRTMIRPASISTRI